MSMWRIRPVVRGEVLAERSEILVYQEPGIKVWVPSVVWYLTDGPNHVLVDTGFDDPAHAGASGAGYSVRANLGLDEALRRVGCSPSLVATILFTHLHWDHCGNLHLFPSARLLVQREEVRYAVAPMDFDASAYNSPCAGGAPEWLGPRLSFLDGETEILPGIRVLPTPGHSPGHQSVLVDTRGGTYGIAGDLFPTNENAHYGEQNGIYPPACLDYVSWHASARKLTCMCDVLLPSHDPQLAENWIPADEVPTRAGSPR